MNGFDEVVAVWEDFLNESGWPWLQKNSATYVQVQEIEISHGFSKKFHFLFCLCWKSYRVLSDDFFLAELVALSHIFTFSQRGRLEKNAILIFNHVTNLVSAMITDKI